MFVGVLLAGAAFTRHGSRPVAARAEAPHRDVLAVDDVPGHARPVPAETFRYSGRWEHVAGFRDGRTDGTSSRSYSSYAATALEFTGTAIRLYGVCGATGGRAIVAIDGRIVDRNVRFSRRAKETHCLVFEADDLPRRHHRLGLIVAGPDAAGQRTYVNIDGAEYDS